VVPVSKRRTAAAKGKRLNLFPIVFASLSTSVVAGDESMPLRELISRVADQGYSIVYSGQVVPAGKIVSVPEVDLDILESTLISLGLRLHAEGRLYAIVRGEGASPASKIAAPVEGGPEALRLIESVNVMGTRHSFYDLGSALAAHSFSATELGAQPVFASDPLRVTTRLPGVSSLGVSARPHIRGGF